MSLKYDFSGKVVLVTGSGSGIGAAIATNFAKFGANVVINDLIEGRVQSVAKQCTDVTPNKSKALEVVADITKEEDLDRLVKTTINTFGKLDILVNNAGIAIVNAITDEDYIKSYHKVMNTNLNSVIYLTHRCVKYLAKTKGNIINISSVHGYQTFPNNSAYNMTKSALNMFTKCIAVELGSKGIRVNSVSPGAIKTGILLSMGATQEAYEKFFKYFANAYPVGRAGVPDDISYAVLYLGSDQASFVTGTNLVVDGGHLAANVNPILFD